MNHTYHSIWNEALGAWVAVSEIAKGQGKRCSNRHKNTKDWQSFTPLLATSLLVCSNPVWALPTGEQLVAGQATVSTPNANQMQIDQISQKAVINWQDFSVQHHESVTIQQPNANAALLNRVVGQNASQIQGQIKANGQVYIVNPNGVVFGKNAQVDVGGLVATTHNINDADFMAGKNHFTQDGAKGSVENHGTIKTPEGGVVALIGEKVTNTGSINTPKGTTVLAAGKTVDLDFKGDGLVEVKVSEAALNAQIANKGAIQADGGRVVLTAKAAGKLMDTVINQDGIVRAQGMVERNGEIILEADTVVQTGTLDASGKTGGTININARAILDTGTSNADGVTGSGGKITLTASDAIIQTAAADTHANGKTTGGTVHLEAANSVYSSGKLSATGEQGGTINVVSNERVVLAAAKVDASGSKKGGLIRVGGDFHGAKTKLSNSAKTTTINGATTLKADGGDGKVVVWSDEKTDYYGSISANKKGNIEVSSKGLLAYAGSADAGVGGQLLLDPANIIISSTGSVASYALIDPHLAAGNLFGANVALLGTTVGGVFDKQLGKIKGGVFTENGNVAVSSSGDDLTATNAGAVYLFNTTTGALLATLTGSNTGDQVGSGGITALTNGNYVVSSPNWNNTVGAATWGNGITGISGIVSVANSFIGSTASDLVSSSGITALSNGNYVIGSGLWDNGSAAINAGAATWGNGITGISGIISAANSLIGFSAFDNIGGFGTITPLTNGNYVVASSGWDNGSAAINAGAVTWGNGNGGTIGLIDSSNSLIGSLTNDAVGSGGITALSNSNYVVGSNNWNAGRGAATWGNGNGGTIGVVNSGNSLVGFNPTIQLLTGDQVSSSGITALTNGNYVVGSGNWSSNDGYGHEGAATWGNGATGSIGTVSATNSLVGSSFNDRVSSRGITALTNGNFVVASPNWSSGSGSTVGAATWGNGATGSIGTVSTANSLVGAFNRNDQVSSDGITALTNGNYVVGSSNWNAGRGAATWGNGATGSNGTVSVTNSLVGISPNTQVLTGDRVSSDGITALTNGNYVVGSSNWNTGRGAATWSNGATGSIGAVSATNSLIGFTAATTFNNFFGDFVSSGGVTALSNGNYVVKSSVWNNGTIAIAGATTWGNGLTGINGIVSTINSLTGSATRDFDDGEVASVSITGLSNGNYVVSSDIWDNGSLIDAGQVRIATPQNIFFNNGLGQTMTFNPSTIATTLALGTSITLQASNDLTLDVGTDIIVGGSNGGALTLQAGRNLTLNSSIFTANGNFTGIAGDPNAIAADRGAGTPSITLGSGASINAGAGQVVLAAIGGNFVNNTGSTAPITAAQWLVYSTDPRLNSLNGMVADFKHYGQDFTGITPSYASSGNWFFYGMTPVLTVTPNSQTITYGGTPADFTFTLTGFIDGDTIDTAGINGLAGFGIDNFTGAIGRYNVAYLSGLASRLGYIFVDNTVSIDELTVISPVAPTVEPAILFDPNFLLSQISTLQQSNLFLPWEHQKLANGEDDFVDIKDKGIKLPNFDDPFNIHCEDPAGYLGGASRNWMLASPASMTAFVNLGTLFNWIDVH